MKNSVLIISVLSLALISCKKENTATISESTDSTIVKDNIINEPVDSTSTVNQDSIINNAPITKEVLERGVMRDVKNNKITRTVDAEALPGTFGEEFTEENQELIIKINNYPKKNISAKITTEAKDFNIRFNQIKTPDGKYDGPFGKEITHEIPSKGEVWLIIGKSNMASGKTTGKFSVTID